MDKFFANLIKTISTSEILLTIVSGVIVFVLCQLIVERVLNPIKRYKEMKESIASMLVENAPFYINPLQLANNPVENVIKKYEYVFDETRQAAAKLKGFIEVLPKFYIGIPKKKRLYNVSVELIGLSNGGYAPYDHDGQFVIDANKVCIMNIKKGLKLSGYKQEKSIR